MSRLTRDIHARKYNKISVRLRDYLSRCKDEDFLQLLWSVGQLQSRLRINVAPYLNYPQEAATSEIGSPYAVHKWNIETLALLALSTPKLDEATQPVFYYNCMQFGTLGEAVNLLRKLENSEWATLPGDNDIFIELHRIGHQQFSWQRGFATSERFYRFAYLYGQGLAGDYFRQAYGLDLSQFLLAGFMLHAILSHSPWTRIPDLAQFGISSALLESALLLLSRPLDDVRRETKALIDRAAERQPVRLAYMPSALRRFPIVSSKARRAMIAPLPDLIIFRMTGGLYYDFAPGGQAVINDVNDRFEDYARHIISAFYPELDLLPSERYGTRRQPFDTPDVLLNSGKDVTIVFECKATKLTYEAQFAENPLEEAEKAYLQIIKAVKQIWRFFSHARRGIYTGQSVYAQAHGVVLTMDAWTQMSELLQNQIMDRARQSVADDTDITDADMRPVVFCPIQDLVDLMFISTADDLHAIFAAAKTEKYRGWGLREVRRNLELEERRTAFPLRIEDLLPWWEQFQRKVQG